METVCEKVQWFNQESIVFLCLRHMITDGWVPSTEHKGVVYGDVIARPIKKEGEDRFSGVAIFKIKGENNER